MAEDIIRDIQHIVENDMLVLSFETPHLHYMSIGALLSRYDDSMWDTANNTVAVRLKQQKPISNALSKSRRSWICSGTKSDINLKSP
jgi:hypothetical protein